jgi:hypothetical protein
MERHPHDPDDPDRGIPERERLYPGEAEDDGQLPHWGARTLARALADLLPDQITGGLHHFAITGRINRTLILTELAQICAGNPDEQEHDWAAWLGANIAMRPDDTPPTEQAPARPGRLPYTDSTLEKINFYLRGVFLAADARGEPIPHADAQTLATLLTPLLGDISQMGRFADTGAANTRALLQECRFLQSRTWQIPQVGEWAQRLAHFLSAHRGPGQDEDT